MPVYLAGHGAHDAHIAAVVQDVVTNRSDDQHVTGDDGDRTDNHSGDLTTALLYNEVAGDRARKAGGLNEGQIPEYYFVDFSHT